MFERLDTWLILWLLVWVAVCAVWALVADMKKRLAAAEKKAKGLRVALVAKTAELHQARAAAEAIKNLAMLHKDDEIAALCEKLEASERECKRLEILLNQKWKAANGGES